MNIKKKMNSKRVELVEWVLEKEHDDFYSLKKSKTGAILNLPKVNFKHQQKNNGAFRDGKKFYLPKNQSLKL